MQPLQQEGLSRPQGIYELMTMTPQVREMAFKGESTQNVRKMARKQGMRTLFEDGMIKAIRGITTIEEVLRITQRDMVSEIVRPAEEGVSGRRLVRGATRDPDRRVGAGFATASDRDAIVRPSAQRSASAVSQRAIQLRFSLDRRVDIEIMMVRRGSGISVLTSRRDITNRWTPGLQEKVNPSGSAVLSGLGVTGSIDVAAEA